MGLSLHAFLSLSLQTPTIENPITPNTAVTKTAVIKRQRKNAVLSQLPFSFVNCFQWIFAQKEKTNVSNAAWCPNRNDRKSVKCKAKQEKETALTQRTESTLEKRSAFRVEDTLRTKPWQHVFSCDTARRQVDCRKHELSETLRKLLDIDFRVLGLPLLLL